MAQLPRYVPRDPASSYATAQALLAQPDRAEVDMIVPDWLHEGHPLRIRVRGLGLVDQDAIYRAERLAVRTLAEHTPEDTHYPVFAAQTLKRFFVIPRLDEITAMTLVDQGNPAILRALVDLAWGMADRTQADIEVILATLTDPTPESTPPVESPPSRP